MQEALQITFRNVEQSDAVEARIRTKAEKLDQFHDSIVSCHVTIEAPNGHSHKGNLFDVKIEVTLPGKQLVVSRAAGDDHAHEDVYVTIRDAFQAMTRQLQQVNGRVHKHR
jgi:ribosomal subunit interface protein